MDFLTLSKEFAKASNASISSSDIFCIFFKNSILAAEREEAYTPWYGSLKKEARRGKIVS